MRIARYDVNTAAPSELESDVTRIDFGSMDAGTHCSACKVIRPIKTTENTVNDVYFFLENKGTWSTANFGFYKDASWDSAVSPGDSKMSVIHLDEVPSATDSDSASGESIAVDTAYAMDYAWLDIQPAASQTGSTTTINYRLLFDYT